MGKNLKKHALHYCVYALIFGVGLLLVLLNKQNTSLEAFFIFMIAILYFTWSMVHHYIHHDLHVRVVIEYILIVALGLVLSFYLFQV